MSDGLTVPFALAAGLSGTVVSTGIIVVAGIAEIAAGSIAMGLGGYLAARTDRDHYQSEREREIRETVEVPEREIEEVADVFRGYGMSEQDLAPVVKAVCADQKRWVDFMMRFELGFEEPDPSRARNSAATIAISYILGGLVPLALGSDTNGSIRVPSSFCGIFGLKPTYGRLSRAGSFPFVFSLDHLGPFARSVGDLALAYDAMQGPDPDDAACTTRPAEPVSALLAQDIGGLRVAIAGGYFQKSVFPEAVEAVARVARALGATRVVEIPEAARARAAAYVITATEGASLHLDRLRQRPGDFDPAVRDRLLAGAMIPAPLVDRAQKFRRWYRAQVLELFKSVDVILAPATPCVAPKLGQTTFVLDGIVLPVRANIGVHTQPISFIGLPVVAVPVPLEPMPIGVQIIAAPWREDIALRVAFALERAGAVSAPPPRGL